MRDPFVFTGECTGITVDIEVSNFIPESLPFCSIPSFTTPTYVPRFPEVIVPDIALPDICRCIEIHGSGGIGAGGAVEVDVTRLTDDCCEQEFDINIEVPCMPLSFDTDATISVGGDSADVTLEIEKASGTCAFNVDLDIDVPCLPFTAAASGSITVYGDNASISVRSDLTGSCNFDLDVDVKIPCLPFTFAAVGAGFIGSVVVLDNAAGFSGFVTGTVIRNASNCEFELDMNVGGNVQIPCLPFGISGNIEVSPGTAAGDFTVVRNAGVEDECDFALDFDIIVPGNACKPFSIDAAGTAHTGTLNLNVNAGMVVQSNPSAWEPDECKLSIFVDLQLPDNVFAPGFSCGDLNGGNLISVFQASANGTCEIEHNCSGLFGTVYSWGGEIQDLGKVACGSYECLSWNERCHRWYYTCGHLKYINDWTCGEHKITLPQGAGFTCTDLTAGPFISISDLGSRCKIEHDCSGLEPSGFDIYAVSCPVLDGNVLKFDMLLYPVNITCGHIKEVGSRQILGTCAITLPAISCGDLTAGEFIDIGDSCTIEHDCLGLNDGEVKIVGVTVDSADDTCAIFVRQWSQNFIYDCGHLVNDPLPVKSYGPISEIYLHCFSCGDLNAGELITIEDSCTIAHVCGSFLDDSWNPRLSYLAPCPSLNDNVLAFPVLKWASEYKCGHMVQEGEALSDVSCRVTLPFLTCEDIFAGTFLTKPSISACTLDHVCAGLHNGPVYPGSRIYDVSPITGGINRYFARQMTFECGHLLEYPDPGSATASPLLFNGATDNVTVMGPDGSTPRILEFKNGLYYGYS